METQENPTFTFSTQSQFEVEQTLRFFAMANAIKDQDFSEIQ